VHAHDGLAMGKASPAQHTSGVAKAAGPREDDSSTLLSAGGINKSVLQPVQQPVLMIFWLQLFFRAVRQVLQPYY
jgi:hypothetical protein